MYDIDDAEPIASIASRIENATAPSLMDVIARIRCEYEDVRENVERLRARVLGPDDYVGETLGVMWLADGPATTAEQVKERASLMLRSWQAKADKVHAKIETIAMVYGVSASDIEAILEETSC